MYNVAFTNKCKSVLSEVIMHRDIGIISTHHLEDDSCLLVVK